MSNRKHIEHLKAMYRNDRRLADAFISRCFTMPGRWTEADTDDAVARCEERCAALLAAIALLEMEGRP